MKRLYFIRHGLSEMNKLGIFSGHTETPLSAEGRHQAQKAGQAAKNLKIDLIVSSPLDRAIETARIIAREMGYPEDKILLNPLLIERHFGQMEGKPWTPGFVVKGVKDAEQDKQLLKRARKAIDWLESLASEGILVVSHGGIGRALRKVVKEDTDFHERIPNAEITCWIDEDKVKTHA